MVPGSLAIQKTTKHHKEMSIFIEEQNTREKKHASRYPTHELYELLETI